MKKEPHSLHKVTNIGFFSRSSNIDHPFVCRLIAFRSCFYRFNCENGWFGYYYRKIPFGIAILVLPTMMRLRI